MDTDMKGVLLVHEDDKDDHRRQYQKRRCFPGLYNLFCGCSDSTMIRVTLFVLLLVTALQVAGVTVSVTWLSSSGVLSAASRAGATIDLVSSAIHSVFNATDSVAAATASVRSATSAADLAAAHTEAGVAAAKTLLARLCREGLQAACGVWTR